MNKSKMFYMRISEADYDSIKRKAEKAKLNMTGHVTMAALDKKIVVVDGLDKVLAELKAIGRNLNQLTTLCNMGKGKIQCPDLTEIKKGYGAVFDYLYDLYENADGQKYKLLSGQNCCGDTAFKEFMATKRQYGKEKGVYFYQYVQSFKPDVKVTPQEIHQMGIELARYFDGFEV